MPGLSAESAGADSENSGLVSLMNGFLRRIRNRIRGNDDDRDPVLPLSNSSNHNPIPPPRSDPNNNNNNNTFDSDANAAAASASANRSPPQYAGKEKVTGPEGLRTAAEDASTQQPQDSGSRSGVAGNNERDSEQDTEKRNTKGLFTGFGSALWLILTHSWVNVLLVFVPAGIAVAQLESVSGPVVFALNCLAIVPLAGLLSFATECVARKMGDAPGALMNVTFGNAVELIIFIALKKDEVRIVQASLLGSILSNLLLILGMCFLCGGLRYREQIYNSTVTQMSACLLSLAVISLVLPTAFHASWANEARADEETLKISRGTSIILLVVYVLYLLFQLKSHSYMYESTPQHIVDAESTPGPVAAWLDSSSSSDNDSLSSDSDTSQGSKATSNTIGTKMKKVFRSRRRKLSNASAETADIPSQTPPLGSAADDTNLPLSASIARFARIESMRAEAANADIEDERSSKRSQRRKSKYRKKYKKHRHSNKDYEAEASKDAPAGTSSASADAAATAAAANTALGDGEPRRVDFAPIATDGANGPDTVGDVINGLAARRAFPTLRAMSVRNLAPAVFVQPPDMPALPSARSVPRVRYGVRRTNSLPDRLNQNQHQTRPPGAMRPSQISLMALTNAAAAGEVEGKRKAEAENDGLTRPTAIILLLTSTALVAVCAEFLVDSIRDVTATGKITETFIGLILLPIVGNAAEHVTALVVAMKNKMDLAIGVCLGSSLQIALFVTPLIVIIGWGLGINMTLYFTLFETACLFTSAFIVNFLVLDGRSNYLEGALLCSTYVIIAVAAAFFPEGDDASAWGE